MILMLGDVHGDIRHLPRLVEKLNPAAVIFLGDIEAPLPLEAFVAEIASRCEVWWIPGNHDTDTEGNYVNLFESSLADRNLHGRVAVIDGLRIAGLGGVFRGQTWYPPEAPRFASFEELVAQKHRHQRALTPEAMQQLKNRQASPEVLRLSRQGQLRKQRSSIFHEEWQQLCEQQADILVTHEAPSCHPLGFREIDQLAGALGVKSAFHGHQHDCRDYRAYDSALGFRAYGVGFRGVTAADGTPILPGLTDMSLADGLEQVRS